MVVAMRPVLVALACVALGSVAPGQQSDPVEARSKGRPDAPVTVYEMSDFQCPYCRDFALHTMPVLDREYVQTGKVRLVYINLPLTQLHPHALAAAELAMCAARQRKFWPVHDLLFERQDGWAHVADARAVLLALGDSAGLDHGPLLRCFRSEAPRAAIVADSLRAARAGAHSTPTFYIEGGLLEGAAPVEVFRQVLDSIYQARSAGSRAH
jgi:protein-disulfide isomerase